MDLEQFKQFIIKNQPELKDFDKSKQLINSFFDGYLIPGIISRKWNMCISIDRKGSIIFKDQQLRKYVIKGLRVTSDGGISSFSGSLTNQSILIFDDSLKDGDNIRRVLNSILPMAPEKITVAAILCSDEALKKLGEEYPNVDFYMEKIIKRIDFVEIQSKMIQPYLDYVCLPIQKDHPILAIRFSTVDSTIIFDFFSIYGEIINDGNDDIVYIDQCKKTLKPNKDSLAEVSSIIKQLDFIDDEKNFNKSIIIRMYWIEGMIEPTLLLQPILGDIPYNDSIPVESMEDIIKAHIILKFLMNRIVLDRFHHNGINITGLSIFLNKNDWWAHL